MNRRRFLRGSASAALSVIGATLIGCRDKQYAHVLKDDQKDVVGSHCAGAETYRSLIEESVGKLLGRHCVTEVQQAGVITQIPPKRIAFVGLENKSAEEIGDFKAQIVETIENKIVQSRTFIPISKRYVEVGLRQIRVRPDELLIPANQRAFLTVMEQAGQPFDYLLFATLTSGTTRSNKATQRDYQLTLELVNINDGSPDRESAMIRKGYHKTRIGKRIKYGR